MTVTGQASRRRKLVVAIVLLPFALFLALVASNAWARHRLGERAEFWDAAIRTHLSPGSDADAVEAFARANGLDLGCRAVPGVYECSAMDKREFGTLPAWRLWLRFHMRDGKLEASEVIAVGVGL